MDQTITHNNKFIGLTAKQYGDCDKWEVFTLEVDNHTPQNGVAEVITDASSMKLHLCIILQPNKIVNRYLIMDYFTNL